jgi:SRSO17 transposase
MGRPPKPRYREKPSSLRALALEARSEATVEISWREGTTGELHSRFLALQVRLANIGLRNRANRQGSELPARWLLCEWPEDASEPVKYWLSNLSEQTLLLKLVRLAKLRWRIEHDYHELKDALGLDHFEGRSYRGWNHHVTLVSIAHAYPHPGTHSPETQGSSLSLFALARELQALLACWQGTCPTCRRELPPNHPPRPPPT